MYLDNYFIPPRNCIHEYNLTANNSQVRLLLFFTLHYCIQVYDLAQYYPLDNNTSIISQVTLYASMQCDKL